MTSFEIILAVLEILGKVAGAALLILGIGFFVLVYVSATVESARMAFPEWFAKFEKKN